MSSNKLQLLWNRNHSEVIITWLNFRHFPCRSWKLCHLSLAIIFRNSRFTQFPDLIASFFSPQNFPSRSKTKIEFVCFHVVIHASALCQSPSLKTIFRGRASNSPSSSGFPISRDKIMPKNGCRRVFPKSATFPLPLIENMCKERSQFKKINVKQKEYNMYQFRIPSMFFVRL